MQNSNKLKVPAFIADCHLGKLTKYLRLLGLDTLYFPQIDDDVLIDLANAQNRIILTRDKGLYERKEADCLYLESIKTEEQLREIIRTFSLQDLQQSFSRCIVCNELLIPIDKQAVEDRLPPKVVKHFSDFEICKKCNRIYWQGDHYQRMKTFLESVFKSVG